MVVNNNLNDINSILSTSVNNLETNLVDNVQANIPDDIDPGSGPNGINNPILRRWWRWNIINSYKQAHATDSYGPTVIKTPNESMMELNANNNFIIYDAQYYIPTGIYSHIDPSAVIGLVRGFSITPSIFAGLAFDPANGVIRGVPTVVSSNTFTISVTGTPGISFSTSTTIQTYSPSCVAVVNYLNRYLGFTGIPLTITPDIYTLPAGGVEATINPTLPAGLTFTSATGVISGTPTTVTAKKHYSVRIKAAPDSICNGNIYADSFYLAVSSAGFPSAVYPFGTSSFTLNSNASVTPTVWSNIGAATISPTLPTGLTFASATGKIGGTGTVLSPSIPYTISFSGTGGAASIADDVSISLSVSSPGNTMSAITLEVIPQDANLRWDYNDPNFSAVYVLKDYRGATPSSISLSIGQNTAAKNIFKYVLERCRPYQETVLFRNGFYPQFNIGKKSNSWNDAWVASGIKGVRLIADVTGSAVIQAPDGIGLFSQASTAANTFTLSAGIYRDIAFSGFYFEGPTYGNKGIFTNLLASGTWWPGLHFYDCTFDGMWRSKWLHRLYNMNDYRAIGCTFKNNWMVSSNYTEHAAYISTYAGNNWFVNNMFSGIGRNAIQLNSYSAVYAAIFDPPSGSWVISGCSAVECGLSNWYVDANGQFVQATNGTVFYTIANTSAVWMLDCMASGGFGTPLVSGYAIPKSTGALVVWKNPFFSTNTNTEPWPSFYGNKLFVTSGCNFRINNGDRAVCEFKNVSSLYIYSGTYASNNRNIFTFSSYGPDTANQAPNPNNLPIIASTVMSFPLNTTTFPNGANPLVYVNCPNGHSCTTLTAAQFSALVTASNPPPLPTPPVKPADGTFLFAGGWTNPSDGHVVP